MAIFSDYILIGHIELILYRKIIFYKGVHSHLPS